jgi:predicted RNase H-like HicB family nuclease
MADGPSYEAAVVNAQRVIREWLETAKELDRPIPEAQGHKVALA